MSLPESFRIQYEIVNYWVLDKGLVKIYIAETDNKRYMTFSTNHGIEEDDYKFSIPSYQVARNFIADKYGATGIMKKF
ncbi:hypothetical protein [Psychrobacillus sp. FSL K6-1415]|uniref:hypothetical protein n=1 Tax=Psychrobacillus sp. FSL K6-1415 TaxID=2921544 RepID=UPI0030F85F37